MDREIPPTSLITAENDVVACDLAGGAALLDLRSSTYFSLNEVGAYVWQLLSRPITISELQASLVERYEVAADRCLPDLLTLIEQFREAKLVRVTDAA